MRFQRPTVAAFTALLIAGATNLQAQATPTTPAAQPARRAMPSSRASAQVSLAYPENQGPAGAQPVTIRLDYGQPHLRGRALHTADLVPYDTPWRTGANAPTTLTTGVDLTLGGQPLPAGSYVLFTLPSRSGWKLIVQKNTNPDATQGVPYAAANDLMRIDLRRETLAAPMESLTMWLIPSTGPGAPRGELKLAWGATLLTTDWVVR